MSEMLQALRAGFLDALADARTCVGWPLSWLLYAIGHVCSLAYQWAMRSSAALQDWCGYGPWSETE